MHFQQSTAITALSFWCSAHVCLASLSNLTDAEPEIPSAAYNTVAVELVVAQEEL